MKKLVRKTPLTALAVTALLSSAALAAEVGETPSITPKAMADALHLVMDSDRTIYTKVIVNRLVKKEKVIQASEHFEDDQALALPAQMFRFGSELVAKRSGSLPEVDFSYSLQSLWPVNKQNAPKTAVEKAGLKYIAENQGQNYYAEEELGGKKYFTAIYPDVAVAPVCTSCHNNHKDSPKRDFKLGEVMGGVVIRLPL